MQWRSQQWPDRPGFPRYTRDLISAELPCGASWLANVLLELNVPIFDPWSADTRAEWRCIGRRRFRYQRTDGAWRRLLPSLIESRVYDFRKHPVPRVGHHWPGKYQPELPAILVVRDPRDALYSAWRRERSLGAINVELDFNDFVNAPFRTWPLSWSAYFALHTAAWRKQIADGGGLLVRFEDFKSEPMLQARRVLEFLKLRASPAALDQAVAASDHAQIQRAEIDLIQRGTVPTAVLAGGQAEEWRAHFSERMHSLLPDWIWKVFEPLRYTPKFPGTEMRILDLRALGEIEERIQIAPGSAAALSLRRILDELES